MIKVAIADDQGLLREMLSMVISSREGFLVAGLAENGEEIVRICSEKKPDIVLMDVKMPVVDGICALEAIKKNNPEIKVIMLTTFGDEKSVLDSFKKGADGYVLKDIKPELLLLAIKCISEGLFIMQQDIADLVRKRIKPSGSALLDTYEKMHDEYGLDLVDRKIIRLLVEGKNNKEIGEVLNYSEGSVKNRLTRILDATGLKDRTQVAVFALKNNLV